MLSINDIEKMYESKGIATSNGKTISVNQAKPSNIAATKRALWENKEMLQLRESFKKKFGVDFADSKAFPVMDHGFSWEKAAERCGTTLSSALREADSGSSFSQVLRAGVQSIVNQMYQTVETSYESWVQVVQSTRDTELYAPLHGISFLSEIGNSERYPEARAAGLDIKLKNRKFGTHYAIEKSLLEDDQSGQFARQAGLMGEYAKLVLEVYVMGKLASVATGTNYANLNVPKSETQPDDEANFPFTSSAAPFVGGGYNRPTTYGGLIQSNIQEGFIGLMNQKNKLGLKMMVRPNRILIGPKYRFDLAVLLNSGYYPSVSSATPGAVGANFAINPIEGIAAMTVSRFMGDHLGNMNGDSKAWYLMDDNVPFFILQIRQGAEVQQENPSSGESFDRDIVRFKVSLRANADHIDSRFIWRGNDGSV